MIVFDMLMSEQKKLEKYGEVLGLPFKCVEINELLSLNSNNFSENSNHRFNEMFLFLLGHSESIYKQAIITYLLENDDKIQSFDINTKQGQAEIRKEVVDLVGDYLNDPMADMINNISKTYPLKDFLDYFEITRKQELLENNNDKNINERVNEEKFNIANNMIKSELTTIILSTKHNYYYNVHDVNETFNYINQMVHNNDPDMLNFINQLNIDLPDNSENFDFYNVELSKQITAVYFIENYFLGDHVIHNNLGSYLNHKIKSIENDVSNIIEEKQENNKGKDFSFDTVMKDNLNRNDFTMFKVKMYELYVLGDYDGGKPLKQYAKDLLNEIKNETVKLVVNYQPIEEMELNVNQNIEENNSKKSKFKI